MLMAREREAVIHDLAESRKLLAWYARERAGAVRSLDGHHVKSLAAELAGDTSLADFHHRMALRQRESAEYYHERRALLLQDVRNMERDLGVGR